MAGTTIASVGGGSLTLSGNLTAAVGSGDTIAFYQPGEIEVLNALLANVGGSVTAANAIALLLGLAAIGSTNTSNPAQADATKALLSLAISGAPGVSVAGVVSDISTAVSGGTLTSSAGFDILAALAAASGTAESYVQSALAGGLIGGNFTIAQIDGAVTGNPQTLSATDAIAALADAASSNGVSGTTRSAALAELQSLATAFPASAGAALPGLLLLAENSADASIRAAGYGALNGLVTANPALGAQIVAGVLNLIVSFPTFAGIVADAQNELFGPNALVTESAVTFNAAISDISALPGADQVPLFVQMLGLPGQESAMFPLIEQKLHVSPPAFTPDQVIAAIAQAYGADTARGTTTANEFTSLIFDFLLQQPGVTATAVANEFVSDIAIVASTTQVAILANLLVELNPGAQAGNATDTALVDAFSARINLLLSTASLSDYAASLGTLFTTGAFTAAQVVQGTFNFYNSGSLQNFLTLIADLPAAGVPANLIAGGIVDAVTAGTIGASFGIELLLVIGTQSTTALRGAAIANLAEALADGATIATNAVSSIAAAISDDATSAAVVVTMLAQLPFSQPTIASSVAGYIAALVNEGLLGASSAATAMTVAAHGATSAQQYAIGREIAGLGFGSDSSVGGLVVNAIVAASGPTAGELLAVIAGFVGQAGTSLQLGVGEALATLVSGGTFTAGQVAGAFDASYISGGVTTPAQLNTVIVGLLAGGSLAAAAEFGFDLGFAQEPVSAIAAALSSAVSANTITPLQVVDLAPNLGLQYPASQTIIAPLLASRAITGQAAVQELGTFIGATQLGNNISTFQAAEFMSVFDGLAGASTSATQSSMESGSPPLSPPAS